jgi:DnaJ family protein C protein 11
LVPQATSEDIQKAFRKFARAFHPDKFNSPVEHENAQSRFIELREAADVLLDENKRQIYDMYGVKGLKQNLQLGERLKTPEEVRQRHHLSLFVFASTPACLAVWSWDLANPF